MHGENGPDKGNNLKALVVVGPDSGATINIKAAVAPGQHISEHLQLLKVVLHAAKIGACLGISRLINTDNIMLGG